MEEHCIPLLQVDDKAVHCFVEEDMTGNCLVDLELGSSKVEIEIVQKVGKMGNPDSAREAGRRIGVGWLLMPLPVEGVEYAENDQSRSVEHIKADILVRRMDRRYS